MHPSVSHMHSSISHMHPSVSHKHHQSVTCTHQSVTCNHQSVIRPPSIACIPLLSRVACTWLSHDKWSIPFRSLALQSVLVTTPTPSSRLDLTYSDTTYERGRGTGKSKHRGPQALLGREHSLPCLSFHIAQTCTRDGFQLALPSSKLQITYSVNWTWRGIGINSNPHHTGRSNTVIPSTLTTTEI